jgi:hypothetical protein
MTGIYPGDNASNAFGSPNLSADGQEPATHILVATAATEQSREAAALLIQWQLIGFSEPPRYWRLDALSGVLMKSNISSADVGRPWSAAQSLVAAGLQFVQSV